MKTALKYFAAMASASLLSLSPLSAVETDPVGYVTLTIPSGLSILSLPLQKSNVYQGEVTAINGTALSCSITSVEDGFYYLQVVDSTGALGEIVNVSSVSSGVINVASPLPSLSVGDDIAVRPHFTLSDIYATPEFSDGSTITVYTANGGKESFEYVSSATLSLPTGLWADESSEDASEVAILPSEGFVFSNSSASPKDIIVTGAVATQAVSNTLGSSFSIIGSNSPIDTATISSVFADLAIGSTITVYSSGGSLSVQNVYEVFDSEDLDLGEGKTFVRNGEFLGDNDTIPVGSGVVVTPASGSKLVLPAAYTSN